MTDTEYSIVIPAYNEDKIASTTLTQILNFMRGYCAFFEILFVDDGSTDGTITAVENYIRTHQEDADHIKLVKNPHKGKAFAVRTGVLMAQGKYILLCDADMATPIEELKRLMVWINDQNFHIVIASREGVGATRRNEPWIRHLMGKVFNLVIKLLLIRGFDDTQCGFKVMTNGAARDVFAHMILFGDNIPETKKPRVSAFDAELLVVALRLGYRVKSVPVTWTHTPSVRVRVIGESIDMFIEVLRIKMNDMLGKYSL